jgi:hypothetical protein
MYVIFKFFGIKPLAYNGSQLNAVGDFENEILIKQQK